VAAWDAELNPYCASLIFGEKGGKKSQMGCEGGGVGGAKKKGVHGPIPSNEASPRGKKKNHTVWWTARLSDSKKKKQNGKKRWV